MKTSYFGLVFMANILGASAALDTIAGYTGDIPDCALSAFKKAMDDENCEATSFDCLCRHSSAIAVAVAKDTDASCSADFAQAIGSACGMWLVDGTTASQYAKATSILADDLDGSGSGGSQSTAKSASDAATDTAAAATASSTSSDNRAAMPTMDSGLVGLVGGAAALAGLLL